MYVFLITIHILICILLCTVILMQAGRGGGLTEAFASAESMFGASTNTMMVKITSILGVIFLVTSLSLAYLSSKKEKSLMTNQVTTQQDLDKKIDRLFDELETKEVIELNATDADDKTQDANTK